MMNMDQQLSVAVPELDDEELPCLLPGVAARRDAQNHTGAKEITESPLSIKARKPSKGVTFASDAGLPIRPRPLGLETPKSCTSRGSHVGTPCSPGWESPQPSRKGSGYPGQGGLRRPGMALTLKSPSSCASNAYRLALTPRTPDPHRCDLNIVKGDVYAILFDFDGTLTRSAGSSAQRCRRQAEAELCERASLLAPHLQALRDAGITLGIVSKSTAMTISYALEAAGLAGFFDGPIVGTAVGFEGKAGFIEELVTSGTLPHVGVDHVLLVDDDVRELERCRVRGIQTYAAPEEGGLQQDDFDDIFRCLGM